MWICCQLGAREHYSIPYALHQAHELELLITDAWADGLLPWRLVPGSRPAERVHAEIPSPRVESFDWSLLTFEFSARRRLSGWERTIARNEWFQAHAVRALRNIHRRNPQRTFTVFSYSYTARKVFEFANQVGWRTVLGQIDPGPFEEKIVSRLHRDSGSLEKVNAAPETYWTDWRAECGLADRIVVNSEWSRQALCTEGIDPEKLSILPLVYTPPLCSHEFVRSYPSQFDLNRPLRVLFLGQVNLRKGAGEILAALPMLQGLPVEFWIVGPVQFPLSAASKDNPQVKWFGAVPRGAVMNFYRDADVFLFPTFSDGFGLTQLEAQAWGLPLIASRNCGEVVRPLVNGYLLPEVSAAAIAQVVRTVLADPAQLATLSGRRGSSEFMTGHLAARLSELEGTLQHV